ncbi:GntR family transcriptional regulator [Jannaschia aquimarina]|uniref:YdfH_2 protein n=1 Tax=Jannaschia aquimarina TaxID=935700 RepID=A0A0D1EPK5_9RHOB|nr:GntR family transcriptional regulator [Jannaschia aquimarina]KIT17590.1 putative HTH-type transcriptional regulator YdfH [Jannaschia aquimarina]SNS72012.1 transcriptional regulator, GntR family [Jannaschia aquimarina]
MEPTAPQDTQADRVAAALEGLIFDGVFSDGDRLDEVRIAEQYGVSRTPVREAFQRLAQSGLVRQLPRRGAFVRQPGPIELIEMFEVMAELEAAAARLAAGRITDEALDLLKDLNRRSDDAVRERDADRYYDENERFHAAVYAQSGNGFLERECLRLQRRLRPFRRRQLRLRGRLRQSLGEHRAIVAALEDGDATAAADAIRAHVTVQGEKFHHLIASLRQAAE